MTGFLTTDLSQLAVQELDFEVLLRTAVFKSTNQWMGYLFQKLADRIDAAYQPKPGYVRKGRAEVALDFIFGSSLSDRCGAGLGRRQDPGTGPLGVLGRSR